MDHKEVLPITLVCGKVFLITGITGTMVLAIVCVLLPPELKLMVLSGVAFPIFWLLGLILFLIGKQQLKKQLLIRVKGAAQPALVTEILPLGRRPVRNTSMYGAVVQVKLADGTAPRSRLYFYGQDYAKIEEALKSQRPIEVIYCPEIPDQVIFS